MRAKSPLFAVVGTCLVAALAWSVSQGNTEPTRRLPDWVFAWKKASPEERGRIAERMDKEEPFKGLSPAECIRALGPPQEAEWGCRIEHWTGLGPGGVLSLIVEVDTHGIVKGARYTESWP